MRRRTPSPAWRSTTATAAATSRPPCASGSGTASAIASRRLTPRRWPPCRTGAGATPAAKSGAARCRRSVSTTGSPCVRTMPRGCPRRASCCAGQSGPSVDRRTPIAAEGAEISQFVRDVRQEPALPPQPRRLACPSPRGTCDRCPAEVFGWAQIVMIRQPLLAGRGVPHGLTHTGLPRCRPGSAPTVVLRGGFRPRRRSASWALGERLDGVGRRSSEATGNRRATQRSTTPRAATARREPCRPVPRGTSRSRSAPSRVPRGTRQCRNNKARRTGLC